MVKATDEKRALSKINGAFELRLGGAFSVRDGALREKIKVGLKRRKPLYSLAQKARCKTDVRWEGK